MNENDNLAVYKQVKELIVEDILSISYGEKPIKSQEEYARQFNTSRTTVRRAINELVEQGILHAVKGKGTFINPLRGKRDGSKKSLFFSESERAKLYKLSSVVLGISTIPADYKAANALAIRPGAPVVFIERVRCLDGVAENVQRSYLNYDYVSQIDFTDEDLENASLFELLKKKAGLVPAYSDQEIRAICCPKRIADYLHIEPDAPVLYIKRVTVTPDDRIMEYMEDYAKTDVQSLRVKVMR